MNLIACVDLDLCIGKNGKLLERIPEDMEYFRSMTLNKTVIMGRKTFESLPNKKALKDRINIVLTRDKTFKADNVNVCYSVDDVLEFLKLNNIAYDDTFVIGGAEIYDQFIDYCDIAYITRIYKRYYGDISIEFDRRVHWKLFHKSEYKFYNDIEYSFNIYVRSL